MLNRKYNETEVDGLCHEIYALEKTKKQIADALKTAKAKLSAAVYGEEYIETKRYTALIGHTPIWQWDSEILELQLSATPLITTKHSISKKDYEKLDGPTLKKVLPALTVKQGTINIKVTENK